MNFSKIGGSTASSAISCKRSADFSEICFFGVFRRFLRCCKHPANSLNFERFEHRDPGTEEKWRPPAENRNFGWRAAASDLPLRAQTCVFDFGNFNFW